LIDLNLCVNKLTKEDKLLPSFLSKQLEPIIEKGFLEDKNFLDQIDFP
jgi:hypothetical protein